MNAWIGDTTKGLINTLGCGVNTIKLINIFPIDVILNNCKTYLIQKIYDLK